MTTHTETAKTISSFHTGVLSDALDDLGLTDRILRGAVRRSGVGHVAGPAWTILETVTPGGAPRTEFGLAAALQHVPPGSVIVISLGDDTIATFGGRAARRAVEIGAAAVVVDGGSRDLEQIRSSGLSVWSNSVTPVSPVGRVSSVGVNVRVRFGRVSIDPLDLIVADETGVVAIPHDHIQEVLRVAERLATFDDAPLTVEGS